MLRRAAAMLAVLVMTAATAWAEWTGSGTEADPYIISDADGLLLLAHRVNGTSGQTANDYKGKFFKLGADITFTHADSEGDDYTPNYEAIGGYYNGNYCYFKGDFDGDNKTVKGIRIRKDGNGDADNSQGLFGQISKGANVHNVHLTDARIKGYYQVGGIVGYSSGTVTGCTVTESAITATGIWYGTICGSNDGTLSHNYYRHCTVNGTAVVSGKGCDEADIDGALPTFTVTLPADVTIETAMAADLGFSYDSDNDGEAENYWRTGAELTLANTLADVPQGYTVAYTATGATVSGSTLTVADQDVTVSTAIALIDWATQSSGDDADHPYMIYNNDQLLLLAHRVNGTSGETLQEDGYAGKYFKLGADIEYSTDGLGETESNYEAIGKSDDNINFLYFKGHFDGANHVISGIRIYKGGTASTDNFQGLFGQIWGAEVKNVILADAHITGYHDVGGIVGANLGGGTVKNCHVLSTVTIHAVLDGAGNHGGIVGFNTSRGGSTVTHCTSAAAVTSTANYFGAYGGIAGRNYDTVEHCMYFGTTIVGDENIGAVVGFNYGNCIVTNCYYTDAALDRSAVGKNEGTCTNCGLARTITLGDGFTLDGTVNELGPLTAYGNFALAYNDGTNTTLYSAAGIRILLNHTDDYNVIYSATNTADNSDITASVLIGKTLTMPDANVTLGVTIADYATYWHADDDHDGSSEAKAYIITTTTGLNLLANRVNSGYGYDGKYFQLGADIEYSTDGLGETESNYEAIGRFDGINQRRFHGHFDGANHVISGIRIYKGGNADTDNYQGLFGNIYKAEVKNVILADTHITGYQDVGGIVGYNYGGTVTDCHVLSTVTVHAVQNYALGHGGIVGFNTNGSGTVTTHCTSAATVSGKRNVGGIAGTNYSSVEHCIYLGTTLSGKSGSNVGAIIGYNNSSGIVISCYYTDAALNSSAIGNNKGTSTDCSMALRDNADNSDFLNLMAARVTALAAVSRTPALSNAVDITLSGRTLYTDGDWNTLCLPFNVTIAGSPLDGDNVEVKVLNASTSNLTGGLLTLNFIDAPATIAAGTPFIIKWDAGGTDITNPVFTGVMVDATASTSVAFTGGTFTGTYSPLASTDGLLLDARNPNNGACRAALSIDEPDYGGLTFSGWYTDAGFTTPATTIPFANDGTVKLYAKFNNGTTNVGFAKEGYGTYYNSLCDAVLPAGMKARIVTAKADGQALTYQTIADGDLFDATTDVVPAGTAVMLQVAPADAPQTIGLTLTAPTAAAISDDNLLHGSDAATTTTGGDLFYKLSYNTSGQNIGWYWGAQDGGAFTSGAHKAWLALPSSAQHAALRSIGLPEFNEGTTDVLLIPYPAETEQPDVWYDMFGRKLESAPTIQGLYIHNGKTISIK